jgi:hypothetical protein
MQWKINIENKPNQRILVKFEPQEEQLIFIGQYKPHNKDWVDFSVEKNSIEIDAITIQSLLDKTYRTMEKRLKAYENIAEGFNIIKAIEIKEDEF